MSVQSNITVIQELLDLGVDAINYEDLATRLARRVMELFDSDKCTLWHRETEPGGDNLLLAASAGFQRQPGEELPTYPLNFGAVPNAAIHGVTAWIAVTNCICLANSFYDLAANRDTPWFGTHRGKWDSLTFMGGDASKNFRSLLGLPLTYGPERQVIGVVKIENKRGTEGFTTSDVAFAQTLLPFLAIALQTMARREQHERDRQRTLKELTAALPVLDTKEFHQRVVDKTALLLHADICTLWLVNENRSRLVFAANHGVREKSQVPEYRLNWDAIDDAEIDGLTPWVAIRQRSFFAAKYEDLKRCRAHRGSWDSIQWRALPEKHFGSLYAVPLLRGTQSIGVLKIENARGKQVFDAVDRATFDVIADFIALAIELGSRLRSDIVFDFFHLLKQPTTNAVAAFQSLREELAREEPRQERIASRLAMVARNLESVRIWTMNVYGLASTPKTVIDESPQAVLLSQLIGNIVDEVRRLFPEFTCHVDDSLHAITLRLTDLQKKKVEVILFNVFDNSFKYSRPAGETSITTSQLDDSLRISISDNGMGISAGDLGRIFEPYFSRPAPQWTETMGLGLSTVHNLLHELGWNREVRSERGRGTEFTIIIPFTSQVEVRSV